jgi:hypothetical protein
MSAVRRGSDSGGSLVDQKIEGARLDRQGDGKFSNLFSVGVDEHFPGSGDFGEQGPRSL